MTTDIWIDDAESLKSVLRFSEAHLVEDPIKLRLSAQGDLSAPLLDASLLQIEARRKFASKFMHILKHKDFIFPTILAGEQASHEQVARYHASLLDDTDDSLLDMTAGLGIDSLTMGEGRRMTAIELDPLKAAALKHNSTVMGRENFKVVCGDSIAYLVQIQESVDVIFVDPARRGTDNSRIYDPAHCLPDVVGNARMILSKCNRLIVKNSPMLDVTRAFEVFPHMRRLHIVCVRGECKEVLCEMASDAAATPEDVEIRCVNIASIGEHEYETRIFDYRLSEQSASKGMVAYLPYSSLQAGQYLYEPSAAVMKSGAWGVIAKRFPGLSKADVNTHLFVSVQHYPDFPGRITIIESIPTKKERSLLKGTPLNVVVRNYPESAPALASKLKVKPGIDRFLYAFRLAGKPVVVVSRES